MSERETKQCPQCHNMEQYVRNICLTANMLYDLDGCCHYSDVIAAMKREHERLTAAEGLAEMAASYRDRMVAAEARAERLEAIAKQFSNKALFYEMAGKFYSPAEMEELKRCDDDAIKAAKEGKE